MNFSLCEQEKEVAILIAQGYTDVEIAHNLYVSRRRVGVIIASIKSKCKISSRVKIGILAYHLGWLHFEEIIRDDN
ncbi:MULTISPECIES: response regulator transcription factor [Bacillus cereus group]|uniref:Lantibiotic transcription regulator protein n=1 Tax=Bacillus cereus VPC1401 TaxID=870739 RepID=E5AK45_BACCE|nr:LuxR family transcriptional regulator [Bacillus thuringiensis]MED2801206.1 LuxR C-terminal-related transcriptional regulator [Bacillus thuringiensis]CBW44185.1 lantibiotic transcription regulator protein [Bacillus cereus VPC1401]